MLKCKGVNSTFLATQRADANKIGNAYKKRGNGSKSGRPKKTKHTIRRTSILAREAHNQNLILPGQTTNAPGQKDLAKVYKLSLNIGKEFYYEI